MLNTTGDIITEVLVRGNYTTTQGYITDTMLNDWLNQSHRWAAAWQKWPFTERRDNSTSFSTEENTYPSNFRSDGIRYMQIGGKRVQKVDFESYQIYKEEQPSGTDRIFTDHGRTYFINPNIDLSGTITLWGQYQPDAFDTTDLTEETVFSNSEEVGNDAMVNKMLSYAAIREGKLQEGQYYADRAQLLLAETWDKILTEQFKYHSKDRGMWERFDVVEGDYTSDLIKRDQF